MEVVDTKQNTLNNNASTKTADLVAAINVITIKINQLRTDVSAFSSDVTQLLTDIADITVLVDAVAPVSKIDK